MQGRVLGVKERVAQGQVGTVNAQGELRNLVRRVRRPGRPAADLAATCQRPASVAHGISTTCSGDDVSARAKTANHANFIDLYLTCTLSMNAGVCTTLWWQGRINTMLGGSCTAC